MPFSLGDNYCICDLTGKKVLMSRTRKTWDGLRVAAEFWYPKHPQLDVRPIRERMAVRDGRSRPADVLYDPAYGFGTFTLISPDGTDYIVYVDEDGALFVREGTAGTAVLIFYLGHYGITVDNDGALHIQDVVVVKGPPKWKMGSHDAGVEATIYDLTVDTDLALLVTESVWFS